MLPWLICGALALAALVLLARLLLLRRSLDEMVRQLGERLSQDTNSPIFLSTRDPHARKLAAELNVHLKDLRRQLDFLFPPEFASNGTICAPK